MLKQAGITATKRYHTVVIGGQAGLAAGYYLTRKGRDFVILDAHYCIGDSWRRRWDSLRLFTPASFNSLPGMPFLGPPGRLPTKDEMADYLESYATHFQLPVELGVNVETLERDGMRYIIHAGTRRLETGHVVVATGAYESPRVPGFAGRLDPAITQFHSRAYRNPDQRPLGCGWSRSVDGSGVGAGGLSRLEILNGHVPCTRKGGGYG